MGRHQILDRIWSGPAGSPLCVLTGSRPCRLNSISTAWTDSFGASGAIFGLRLRELPLFGTWGEEKRELRSRRLLKTAS